MLDRKHGAKNTEQSIAIAISGTAGEFGSLGTIGGVVVVVVVVLLRPEKRFAPANTQNTERTQFVTRGQ